MIKRISSAETSYDQHQAQLSKPAGKYPRLVEETAAETAEPEEIMISDEEWAPPAEFAKMLITVTELLDHSANMRRLKKFLKFLCHPHTGKCYIDRRLYEHCNTPGEIIEVLHPQYINFMHTHLLRQIVNNFGDEESKALLKRYEDMFPRNKPLKHIGDPVSDEEIESFTGTERMKVVCSGATVDTSTMEDVERVRQPITRNTGIDESVISFASQKRCNSVIFTFLIPETVVSVFSDLDEDNWRDLAGHGILRIEVNELIIDLQSFNFHTSQAVAKTNTTRTDTKADTAQAENKTDMPQAETKTDTSQAETKTDTSQAETKIDTLQAETKTDTSQAETKTDTSQAETKTDTSQAETKTDTSQAETKTDTSQAETKIDTLQAETKTDTSQAETKTDTSQAETKTDTSQAETKTDTSQAETKTDTSQAETKTDMSQAETKTDTSQAQTKTDTSQAETKTEAFHAEAKNGTSQMEITTGKSQEKTKTDISTYTASGMKRLPLIHGSLKATHCNSKFQQLLSEVGASLAESVEASKLRDFLQSFTHILYPETQYIDPSLLKDTESIPQMLTALQPQILNYLSWSVLWKAMDSFHIKVMPTFQFYANSFPPHTKLSTLPDPLSEEEISGFKRFQKLRVTRGGGSRIEWTLGDVQVVREAVEKAAGIDENFIIYAYWEGGFTTHQFTFLIPKSVSGIFGELCEEDLTILAGRGVQRLEVDYDTVADNIQEHYKELSRAVTPVRADTRLRTKNFGLEHFIPEDVAEHMSEEDFSHLNDLITSTPVGKLQEVCSNDFLKVFAKKIGSWKDLAPYLGINQWDLEDLAEWYPGDEEEQKYVALLNWKSIDVNSATYERLVECLLTHGHIDDAEELLLLQFQGQQQQFA